MNSLNSNSAAALVNLISADNLLHTPTVISINGLLGYDDNTIMVEAINPRQRRAGGRVTFRSIAAYTAWRNQYPAEFRAKAKA